MKLGKVLGFLIDSFGNVDMRHVNRREFWEGVNAYCEGRRDVRDSGNCGH